MDDKLNKITNICVICCVYNTKPKYLEECFISIDNAIKYFKRYYDIPIEFHVLDDATDNIDTIYMFNNILDKFKYIKLWKHNKNMGISKSINDLNEHTPDDALVIHMDSDDIMMPNRILVQYEIFAKYDEFKNITCNATLSNTPNILTHTSYNKYDNFTQLCNIEQLTSNFLIHPSIAYKINHIRNFNIKYDESFNCAIDYDFYLQLLSKNLIILLTPDALVCWRQYPVEEKGLKYRDYADMLDKLKNKYKIFNLKLDKFS